MDDRTSPRTGATAQPLHGVWTQGGPVFSHIPDNMVLAIEGRAVASFGDAATLGMWAFATGAGMTGLFASGLFPITQMILIFPLLLVYSGPVLFIAGLFLFRRNNNFLASAFCSFGAFNLSRGVLLLCESKGWVPTGSVANTMQGVLIEVFAYVALSLLLGALRVNVIAVFILFCSFAGYGLSGLPFLMNSIDQGIWANLGRLGGYLLLAAAVFAFYAGSAILLNTAWRRAVLPIGGKA